MNIFNLNCNEASKNGCENVLPSLMDNSTINQRNNLGSTALMLGNYPF